MNNIYQSNTETIFMTGSGDFLSSLRVGSKR